MEYQEMEQEHVQKIEQAIALLQEVLGGEKKEAEMPERSEGLREELMQNFKK